MTTTIFEPPTMEEVQEAADRLKSHNCILCNLKSDGVACYQPKEPQPVTGLQKIFYVWCMACLVKHGAQAAEVFETKVQEHFRGLN